MPKYVGGKEASRLLGVHTRTLYQWEAKGLIETIRTPGNKRLYNVEKFIVDKKNEKEKNCIKNLDELENTTEKLNISYARVSSHAQKADLERQKAVLLTKYPNYKIIVDIGSSINFNRLGLHKIIKLAISGKINELVIAYKDRLTRFGFEFIEDLIKDYSNGQIIMINQKDDLEPEEELMVDVLQIMNVYVSKMNGLRKYKLHDSRQHKKIEKV